MSHFAHPWVFLLLIAIPVIAVLLWRRERPSTITYSDLRLVTDLPVSAKLRLRWVPVALQIIVLILLIFAIARPQSSYENETIRGEGVDIVMALDISGSMAAWDFEPKNRLEAAKQVIGSFIEARRYDRIGLVVFARQAFSQCPPTLDHDVLDRLLEELSLAPTMGLDDGTAIGMGLVQSAVMLQESEARSRVIILLTDGINNAGQIAPLTAAQAAAALNIKVYTIGMGSEDEVPMPVDSTFGQTTMMVESKIDEETLQKIADETGALYFRATDTEGLQRIYDQINRMEKSDFEVQVIVRHEEWAAWFLLPALGLLLLILALRHTVFRTLP